jgi:hypothetical protein
MLKKLRFKKGSLTKELSIILAVKTSLLFVLWWLFFNPQTKVFVDENKMADVLVTEHSVKKMLDK